MPNDAPNVGSSSARRTVTLAEVESFRKHGAVCLRQLFTPTEVALLKEGIDANLAQPSPRAKVASRGDDPGLFIEDFCNWQSNQHYRRFIFGTALGQAAGELMNSSSARLYHDHMLTKEASTRQRTPWHQDQPYYNVEGRQNCSFWIPVDPVSRAASLELVAGSHLGPWLMPRSFMDAQAKWFPEGSLANLPDIDQHREAYRILSWELEPGDAVCSHAHIARLAGDGAQSPASSLFRPFPGRRHQTRAAPLADLTGFPRARSAVARRRADRPSIVSHGLARLS